MQDLLQAGEANVVVERLWAGVVPVHRVDEDGPVNAIYAAAVARFARSTLAGESVASAAKDALLEGLLVNGRPLCVASVAV